MKHRIGSIWIFLLLLGTTVPLTTLLIAQPTLLPTALTKNPSIKQKTLLQQPTLLADEPPAWAKGNFSGVWGYTLIGVPLPPVGWITGYYQVLGSGKVVGVGKFDALYALFNDTNATSFLRGTLLWYFFFGRAGNLSTNKGTWVTGIGVTDHTEFFWRLHEIIGPSLSFYILCNYTAFGNTTTQHPSPGPCYRCMNALTSSFPFENRPKTSRINQ